MKKFVKQLFCFSLIAILYAIIVFIINCADPYKVYKPYNNFYDNAIVYLNREHVCLELLKNNNKRQKYNSFILGSSRSLAYTVPEWKKHLNNTVVGFHFDATGEGIYGIYNKLLFLQSKKNAIKNVLIVLDYNTLTTVKNRKGHLSISPPELSRESLFSYYKEYVFATANFNFISEYIKHKYLNLSIKKPQYIVQKTKFANEYDDITGDVYFGTEKKIKQNELKYYSKLQNEGVFYTRLVNLNIVKEEPISSEESKLLFLIHRILIQEKSNYKIVISPLYNQKKLSSERVQLLITIFGKSNVHDFSGKNELTESIYNFYETSHYRPHVANKIMDSIYK
jgi:hypothetical protein